MGTENAVRRAAIIGTGLIGQGWAIVFARMGWEVRLHDVNAAMLAEARTLILQQLGVLQAQGLLDDADAIVDRVQVSSSLQEALAGASYVQTQPVFDLAQLRPLAGELKARRPAVRVVAMVMPLVSVEALERVTGRLGVAPPRALGERLAGDPESAWPAFEDLLASLAGDDHVDGVAVMTFEMDATPETGARIVAALNAAGIGA